VLHEGALLCPDVSPYGVLKPPQPNGYVARLSQSLISVWNPTSEPVQEIKSLVVDRVPASQPLEFALLQHLPHAARRYVLELGETVHDRSDRLRATSGVGDSRKELGAVLMRQLQEHRPSVELAGTWSPSSP
jgi:hypothetical protein